MFLFNSFKNYLFIYQYVIGYKISVYLIYFIGSFDAMKNIFIERFNLVFVSYKKSDDNWQRNDRKEGS